MEKGKDACTASAMVSVSEQEIGKSVSNYDGDHFTYFRTNNFEKFRSLFLLPSWVEIAGKTGQYPLKLLFK